MTTPEDRLRSELAALADVPMPPDVADRVERATVRELRSAGGSVRAELSAGPDAATRVPVLPGGAVGDAGATPSRPRRPRRAALPAAAAVVALAVVAGVAAGGTDPPHTVGREDDLRSTGAVAFGRAGAGDLADPDRRSACLTTAGVPEPDAALLGGVPYTVDGTPGTLLVLGTAVTGRYRLVVVDPACARVLAEATTGR
ncbi:hypothetical protein [Pseudonocardia endophytica]|uniref:Anti-sigma-M factor RsmA n=1 Tax=Pseudonocardia endophytica TaxID=401976 RepID=A0A4R1I175_PSEEN|nr:hypothetical protein [Pseudonocardia endophytica]TCK27671.1 hypothetical protein EV378_3549 [Pseudonocardia endophytica]